MKTYKITVSGKVFDVSVEEIGGAPGVAAVQSAAPVAEPASVPAPAPAPAAAPTPVPAPPPAAAPSGGEDITAPMSGKVISINVSVGDRVKSGQLLLVFEAMKMENELFAPSDGTIAKIHVAVGATLEVGAPVITLA